jgi:hypothetical protein
MKKDYLIINRAKWRTGHYGKNQTGMGISQLLNNKGYMCCLGFRCHQMGIPKKDLLGMASPNSISNNWDIPDLTNSYSNTEFTLEAVRINDDGKLTSEEREIAITEHFATIGVTVEFTGKYPKK